MWRSALMYVIFVMSALIYVLLVTIALLATPARPAIPEFELVIRDHLFFPSALEIPASVKVRFLIDNQDKTPEEFKSYELNREKVILGRSKTVIFIGPLKPGEYSFFGKFYPKTAQGRLSVR